MVRKKSKNIVVDSTPFEPRPFQKEILDKIVDKNYEFKPITRVRSRWPGNAHYVSVDMGQPDGDKAVAIKAHTNKKGILIFDEVSYWPTPQKWYKHPIKWFKYKRFWGKIDKIKLDTK